MLFSFLLIKIDYVYKKLKEDVSTRVKYRNKELSEMMPTILETVRKRWFSHRSLTSLKCFITRKKKDYGMNSTKVCTLMYYSFIFVSCLKYFKAIKYIIIYV